MSEKDKLLPTFLKCVLGYFAGIAAVGVICGLALYLLRTIFNY